MNTVRNVKQQPILAIETSWMPFYRSRDEPQMGSGTFLAEGNIGAEALNFKLQNGKYYGYFKVQGKNLHIEKCGAEKKDEFLDNVLVVACAVHPLRKKLMLVGWYPSARLYRFPIVSPDGEKWCRIVSKKATLLGEYDRTFEFPRVNTNLGITGMGMSSWHWYGLNEEINRSLRDRLLSYIRTSKLKSAPSLTQKSFESVEKKRRRMSARMERVGARRYRESMLAEHDFTCQTCGWHPKDESIVWRSSLEVHHLTPFEELDENEEREVTRNDLALLCANCHRAIHRTYCVSDLGRFRREFF